MTKSKELAPKTEAFCKAYAAQKSKNASAAFRATRDCSKMKTSTINSNAKKLLRDDSVRLRISELDEGGTPQEHGLTPKQDSFARFYVETGNASEAYRRAYNVGATTKDNVIHVKASELLAHGKVSVRVAELQAAIAKRHEVTVERIVGEYAKMGFANMLDYITVNQDGTAHCDLSKLSRDQAAAIQEMKFETVLSSAPEAIAAAGVKPDEDGKYPKVTVLKTTFKLHDKKGPLQDLGKHLGMFKADNDQLGKAAAESAAAAAEVSNRDLARAVLDILREAKVEKAPAKAPAKAMAGSKA